MRQLPRHSCHLRLQAHASREDVHSLIPICQRYGLRTAQPGTGDEMRVSTLDPSQKAQITAIACLFLASSFSRLSSLRAWKRVRRSDREREAGDVRRRRETDRQTLVTATRQPRAQVPPPAPRELQRAREAVCAQELSRRPCPGEGPEPPAPPDGRAHLRPVPVRCDGGGGLLTALLVLQLPQDFPGLRCRISQKNTELANNGSHGDLGEK